MLQAGPGRGDKQQQEQNSPNLGPAFKPSAVSSTLKDVDCSLIGRVKWELVSSDFAMGNCDRRPSINDVTH